MWTCLDKRAEGVETFLFFFDFLGHVVLDTTRSTKRARPVKQTISRTINKGGLTWLACLHRTCEHCVSSATPEPRSWTGHPLNSNQLAHETRLTALRAPDLPGSLLALALS